MDNKISPKIQNELAMLQQVQQQLQTIVSQKAQYEIAVKEAKRADEELKDVAEGAEVFVSVGAVMMQKNKETVSSSLADKIETLGLRIKSLEKQEKALQTRFEQLQAKIKEELEGAVPAN